MAPNVTLQPATGRSKKRKGLSRLQLRQLAGLSAHWQLGRMEATRAFDLLLKLKNSDPQASAKLYRLYRDADNKNLRKFIEEAARGLGVGEVRHYHTRMKYDRIRKLARTVEQWILSGSLTTNRLETIRRLKSDYNSMTTRQQHQVLAYLRDRNAGLLREYFSGLLFIKDNGDIANA